MARKTAQRTHWKLDPGEPNVTDIWEPELHIVLDETGKDGYLWVGGSSGPCVGHASGKRLRELRDLLNSLALGDSSVSEPVAQEGE